jgi:hypothetical protein
MKNVERNWIVAEGGRGRAVKCDDPKFVLYRHKFIIIADTCDLFQI